MTFWPKKFGNEDALKYTDPTPKQQAFLEGCDYYRASVIKRFRRRRGQRTPVAVAPRGSSSRQRFAENFDGIDWDDK